MAFRVNMSRIVPVVVSLGCLMRVLTETAAGCSRDAANPCSSGTVTWGDTFLADCMEPLSCKHLRSWMLTLQLIHHLFEFVDILNHLSCQFSQLDLPTTWPRGDSCCKVNPDSVVWRLLRVDRLWWNVVHGEYSLDPVTNYILLGHVVRHRRKPPGSVHIPTIQNDFHRWHRTEGPSFIVSLCKREDFDIKSHVSTSSPNHMDRFPEEDGSWLGGHVNISRERSTHQK